MAALASDAATQDPIDLAVFQAAQEKKVLNDIPRRIQFIPFDPATKRSEAFYEQPSGKLRVIKGAPDALIPLVRNAGSIAGEVERLAGRGARVLAIAAGTEPSLELAGLLGLEDPIREDSKALVHSLKSLGVRVIMVTGDGPATARAVSLQVDIGDRVGSAESLRNDPGAAAEHYDVFAGVFPQTSFDWSRPFSGKDTWSA
jgi:H+-transporting ATPase